ncbi:3925_t:CDS:2, partial [Diversispora eburnea]
TIPILWELPLGQECSIDNKKKSEKMLEKKALCIRTYISCMNTQTRTLLTQNGYDLSSSPPQATFDYPSFTHKFIINNLVYFISIYSPQIIKICKLIINRSFLDYFKLAENFYNKFNNYSDLIGSIPKLPGAPKVFKKLESFTSKIGEYERIYPFYESLKLICDNILNMDLKLSSTNSVELLAKLISVQKRLENLSIVADARYYLDNNSIFWAIISQKETLKSLRIKEVNFFRFKGKSSPIGQFISLQELHIECCSGFHNSDCLFLASSFTQLSSIHFTYTYQGCPQEFIKKILETANTNLRNIFLDLHPTIISEIFSTILNYCKKITELTFLNLNLKQVIAIFNNNFIELRKFSFDCGRKRFDANKLLCKMAENVPESLETIEIRMGIFSANSLRNFFEGWGCKERGENKKFIVNRTEEAQLFTLSEKHFKVIEEYGVQFDIEA